MAASTPKEMLTRVRIEGFRSIAYADLELRNVNVFVGANGAGKSNFVGFLQMVSAMMRESLPRYVDEQRGANALLHLGAEVTPSLSARLNLESSLFKTEYRFALEAVAGDRLLVTEEEASSQGSGEVAPTKWTFPAGKSNSAVAMISNLEMVNLGHAAARSFAELSDIRVYHFHNSLPTSPMRGYQDLKQNRFLLSRGENTAVMLMRLRLEAPAAFRRIRDEMRRVLPGFDMFVLEPAPARGMEQVELRWTSRNSEYILGPDQLSDGSIRAVSLLTLLLQPDEWKPGIIVIDEPELGLHPYAVGQIGRLVAEAGITRQVIVSTQSPGLVAQFEPDDIVVVESKNGESSFRRLDRETLGPWLEAYDGDLGRLYEMNVTGGAPE